jgi:ribosomal protein S25
MIRELDETVTLLENHQKDKAFNTIDHIMDDWQKIEFLTDNLVNNRYNIELNIAMSRLKHYIETDNDEIFAEISACQQLLKRTYEGELRL